MALTRESLRRVALSAARGYLRRMGIDPMTVASSDALSALDDLYRLDRELLCAEWYASVSDRELTLFKRDWEHWRKERKRLGLG